MRVILICAVLSFLLMLFSAKYVIRFLKKINLIVKDMNKKDKPLVPISGGLMVLGGMVFSFLIFIFIQTFIYSNQPYVVNIFAVLTTLLLITLVGFIDDLLIHKSKIESSGLRQWQKPLLTLFASIPLIVVNAGNTNMTLPFLGQIGWGLFYPLILIPIGVVGAANMVNMLAGFNGLEAGLGLVYTGMLAIYAYFNNSYLGTLIATVTFFSLIVFYYYNRYPAKVFPGDSLTYLLGASLACIAIIGNLEKAALICSIPFFIEFILKARGKFKVKSYGYYKDGKVKSYYDKIYSIPHIFTRTGKFTEKQVVFFCILIELFFSSLIWLV
ncbi:MAG: glycosyl transferase family 4 [Candidatus Nanoarchaeia archaeon]|nr:glycosyl transferase family 4 [Candidatus Nanoarchaeia archaeon]MDD5587631.1 glycosyl transferase family 4 [Candidatus Nanoarchaeia archaeon]